MNKKGAVKVASEFVVWLVFLLLVISIFMGAAFKIKDNTLHKLRVESRDYAFVQDALSASPYSLIYQYNQNPNITLVVNQEKCIVTVKDKVNSGSTLKFSCGIDQFSTLKFQEIDKKIKITNQNEQKRNT